MSLWRRFRHMCISLRIPWEEPLTLTNDTHCQLSSSHEGSTLSTTTVIMKTLGSEDEGVCGAHDVDNGFDVPRTARLASEQ